MKKIIIFIFISTIFLLNHTDAFGYACANGQGNNCHCSNAGLTTLTTYNNQPSGCTASQYNGCVSGKTVVYSTYGGSCSGGCWWCELCTNNVACTPPPPPCNKSCLSAATTACGVSRNNGCKTGCGKGTLCAAGYSCNGTSCVCNSSCLSAASTACGASLNNGCATGCGTGTYCASGYSCNGTSCVCNSSCLSAASTACGASLNNGCATGCAGAGTYCSAGNICSSNSCTPICTYAASVNTWGACIGGISNATIINWATDSRYINGSLECNNLNTTLVKFCTPFVTSCAITSNNNFIAPTNITLSSTPNGGVAPYSYQYTWNGSLFAPSNNSSVTIPSANNATYLASVKVTDSRGEISTSNCQRTLNGDGTVCTVDCNKTIVYPPTVNGECIVGGKFIITPTDNSLLCSPGNYLNFKASSTLPGWTWDCAGTGSGSPTTAVGCSALKIADPALYCKVSKVSPSGKNINLNATTTWVVATTTPGSNWGTKQRVWKLIDINNPAGRTIATTTNNTLNNIFNTVGLKTISVSVDGGTSCSATTTVIQQGGTSGEI